MDPRFAEYEARLKALEDAVFKSAKPEKPKTPEAAATKPAKRAVPDKPVATKKEKK